MHGSMLISGRNSGQARLDLNPAGVAKSVPTKEVTVEQMIADVEGKIADIKGSRSPVETEINFLQTWLTAYVNQNQVTQEELNQVVAEVENDIKGGQQNAAD